MSENSENPGKMFIRPEKIFDSPLDEEERAMKEILIEEYKKQGKGLLIEVRKIREAAPEKSLGDAIRILYGREGKQ